MLSSCSQRVPGVRGHPTQSEQPATSTTGPAATSTTTTTTVAPEPGWSVVATEATGVAVDERSVTMADGSTITLLRFRAGQVHFDFHVGSLDPPTGSAVLAPDAQSSISTAEAPLLLAAFDGGFKVTADAGGTEVDGQVLVPLEAGLATFLVTTTGALSIGAWGAPGFVPAGAEVAAVRQNLPLLVSGGEAAPDAGQWTAWGATITHRSEVARSALAQDISGNIIFAASMATYPADLAQALTGAGAIDAMELDINPYWVQADVAATAGGPLQAAVPGQERPPTTYEHGWTRDFVTVLAGGPAN